MGRRNITKNILEENIEVNDDQVVAQVGDPLGKNLHQLQYYVNDELVDTIGQLPPKFRNLVWIKRGSFVIATIDNNTGTKVSGTIEKVLFNEHIKMLKNSNSWPAQFSQDKTEDKPLDDDEESEEDEDSDDDLFVNNNRRQYEDESESSEEEDEDEE